MPLYNQIAGVDDPGGASLAEPVKVLMNYGVLSSFGVLHEPRLKFIQLFGSARAKAEVSNAVAQVTAGTGGAVSGWLSDAFKGVQHFAAGMGMQVPRTAFLALVALNAFGYANKLWHAEQFTDTREKLEDIWWRLGGDEVKLRQAIDIGKNKPAATTIADQNQTLIELASAGGTYTDANGIKHDINTGAVVAGAKIGFEAVTASVIASAAIIVAAIMPVISKMLDKHAAATGVPVPGLPVNPSTGLPVGYSGNSLVEFFAANPLPVALGAAVLLYVISENL